MSILFESLGTEESNEQTRTVFDASQVFVLLSYRASGRVQLYTVEMDKDEADSSALGVSFEQGDLGRAQSRSQDHIAWDVSRTSLFAHT